MDSTDVGSDPPGELPPPPPRACFGRSELIEEIVGLAETLTPLALIGTGGIGKTSIALAVLHHKHIKEQFGDNRWFIHCDQFPPSCPHFLGQLSRVIGAGVENPEGLALLRPFLSSREMILFLDNAESVLDPQGSDAREIYAVVKELSQFSNICLCITSRISTIPPACKILDIPTLSTKAANDIFYHIYKNGEQSDLVDKILGQLDCHPLSITLLATVAYHNKWDTDRLTSEWKRQRTNMLYIQHDESLATTIGLSLVSPTFQELGPQAHDLLGVIAFFPQGIDEKNIDWLFPTLPNRTKIFDKFHILSLTYRSNGFITMLAPLRDHLCPQDPASSPLLQTAKACYFHQLSLSVDFAPGWPGFEESEWIVTEDVNIEHLLDVFTSLDINSTSVWDACANFMEHLYWHKPQLIILGPKIEGLPDDHPSKPQCLYHLSWLFGSVGNRAEEKRLLIHTLKLWRKQGNDFQIAETLKSISTANRWLGLHEEGIPQIKKALEIYEQVGDIAGQAYSWQELSWLLYKGNQLCAAEAAAKKAVNVINPFSSEGDHYLVCRYHRILGNIYFSKGEVEAAIDYLMTALGIASAFNWHNQLFWSHHSLTQLFSDQAKFSDAHTHLEGAKSYVSNNRYNLGCVKQLQAGLWFAQYRFEEAKYEALCAADVFERLGAMKELELCRTSLWQINEAINRSQLPHASGFNGELLEMVLLPILANTPSQLKTTIRKPLGLHNFHFLWSQRSLSPMALLITLESQGH